LAFVQVGEKIKAKTVSQILE